MPNLVSIAELTPNTHPDWHNITQGDRPILWDMELPSGIDAERIGIDMGRLRHIHAAGAIAASFVEGYEEVGSEEVSVGSCRDPFDCHAPGWKSVSLNATFGEPAVTHQVNVAELTKQADASMRTTDISPEMIWAELYDGAIRGSMVQAARQSLMGRKKGVQKVLTTSSYVAAGAGIVGVVGGLAGLVPGEAAFCFITAYASSQAAPQVVPAKARTEGDTTLSRRISIVSMNRQPDRYAVTWALCKKSGLVRVAP